MPNASFSFVDLARVCTVANCREPHGASGRHGGDDWFPKANEEV